MTDPDSRDVFDMTIEVLPEHLDAQQHVNNSMYVQWIQDIAVQHWRARMGELPSETGYWVVLEHQIRYRQQAFLGELLVVKTWVEPPTGIRFPRNVEFYRNDELLVSARTLWCWVDAETHRPRRIPPPFLEKFQLPPGQASS